MSFTSTPPHGVRKHGNIFMRGAASPMFHRTHSPETSVLHSVCHVNACSRCGRVCV